MALINANYGHYIAYWHLRDELQKVADVKLYTIPEGWEDISEKSQPLWDARQIVKEFDPDAILIYVNNILFRAISNMEDVDCLKIMMSDDPHNWLERQAKFMNKAKIDIMLMMNYGRWYGKPEDYPVWWKKPFTLSSARPKKIYGGMIPIADKYQRLLSYPCKFINFPEAVNINYFRDLGLPRICDVFNSGSHSSLVYPFREKIESTLRNHPRIKSCIQPSFTYSWDDYAKMISKSKMLVDGGVVFGYQSQRFTQAMASKTLMVAPIPYDNVDNHFIPNETFVEINQDNFVDKILYYLEHEDERNKIINNAYQTVLKYHTTEIRARELLRIIKENIDEQDKV
jgi:hypothetical protein